MHYKLLAGFVLIVCMIGFGADYYKSQVKVEQFVDVKYLEDVPEPVRDLMTTHWMLMHSVVRVQGQTIQYVYYGKEFSIKNRMEPLLKTLVANQKTWRYKIPDGVYLICLLDGVHRTYPWPVLGFSTLKYLRDNKNTILIPDYEALAGYSPRLKELTVSKHKYKWEAKQSKIFWRGQATGAMLDSNDFTSFPRVSFLYHTRDLPYVDAGFVAYIEYLKPEFLKRLQETFPLKPYSRKADTLKFKYLMDIDGQSCSYERMAWIMSSNSLLMKHKTDKVQWYYDKLKPGVNFLSIKEDFSDVPAQYEWAETHPREVQKMIRNANKLALEVFNDRAIRRSTAQAFREYQTEAANRHKKLLDLDFDDFVTKLMGKQL